MAPQFRKRAPGRSDPVTREELQRKAEAWAILCSQLDDYAIAGNQRGVRRVLNRLHHSVRSMRDRHQIYGAESPPFDAQEWERRVTEGMP